MVPPFLQGNQSSNKFILLLTKDLAQVFLQLHAGSKEIGFGNHSPNHYTLKVCLDSFWFLQLSYFEFKPILLPAQILAKLSLWVFLQ